MKLAQCTFLDCNAQIPFITVPKKYCEQHKMIELICANADCGKFFPKLRITYDSFVEAAEKRDATPAFFHSKSCAAKRKKPGRVRGEHGPYDTDNKPIEPLMLVFTESEPERSIGTKRTRNWGSWNWGYYKPVEEPAEDSPPTPVVVPYYACESLSAGTLRLKKKEMKAIIARINNPSYQQLARWEPLYDAAFE